MSDSNRCYASVLLNDWIYPLICSFRIVKVFDIFLALMEIANSHRYSPHFPITCRAFAGIAQWLAQPADSLPAVPPQNRQWPPDTVPTWPTPLPYCTTPSRSVG